MKQITIAICLAFMVSCSHSNPSTETQVASSADILPENRMEFWSVPQSGANSFNASPPDDAYFEALAETGATWVRLAFSKWEPAEIDFLMGNADDYVALPEHDIRTLRKVMDSAHKANIKVVVTPLSLPGARWRQQNNNQFDDRLWSDKTYWVQSATFWRDAASALMDHPALVGYNLMNEPAPEFTQDLAENASLQDNRDFIDKHKGTARDLPGFYEFVISAIREVDPYTPIMLDAGYYANPRNLAAWTAPLSDDKLLYAFHMYEPYEATGTANRRREEPLRYPGVETVYAGAPTLWDRDLVSSHINFAFDWAQTHGLPTHRVVAGEFGCIRTWQDCGTYIMDVLDAVELRGGHWAYYEFRPDDWEGMDYELPSEFPPGRFYSLIASDEAQNIPRDGEIFDIIKDRIHR